jgi:hypothetical protein
MANYLGAVEWGIVPSNGDSSNLATMSWDYRNNILKSANDQIRYQVQWMSTGLNEGVEPSADNYLNGKGDIVNVIFPSTLSKSSAPIGIVCFKLK